MGASSSKASTQTYSYSDIAAAALYSVASTCKGAAVSNQELNIEGSTIDNSVIKITAKQRLECLSTVSADSNFDSKFQSSIDNLLKNYSTVAIGTSKSSTEVKTDIVNKMKQTMESKTSSELFGTSAQTQLVNITNSTVKNSTIDIQADAFVKVVSEVLSKNGVTGEVTVDFKTNADNSASNAATDLGNNAEEVLKSAVGVVGDTAGGIVDTAKTAVTGVLDIVGSPMFMIIAAVIVIAIIYIYLKSPTNPVGAIGAMSSIGAMGPMGAMGSPQMWNQPPMQQQWGPRPPQQQWNPQPQPQQQQQWNAPQASLPPRPSPQPQQQPAQQQARV